MHEFSTQQFLPVTIQEAWNFFSTPKNLTKITPPEMDFRIITSHIDDDIYENMRIQYSVKPLFGIPVLWQTRIGPVQAPFLFSDIQEKGPYKYWKHTHHFIEQNGGTLMIDEIKYQLPLGLIGKLVHRFLVRKKIENIFAYRKNILTKIFTGHDKRFD